MKFIYSLMLFTFLMSTFTPVAGWGGSCVNKYNSAIEACDSTYANVGGFGTNGYYACKAKASDQKKVCEARENVPVYDKRDATIKYPFGNAPTTMPSSTAPAPASGKKETLKQPPKPKSTTTPVKEETKQVVSVPESNTFHCNDKINYKSGSCYCNKNETKKTVSANTLNATISECVEQPQSSTNPTKSENSIQSSQFACLKPFQYYVDDCEQKAKSAIDKCDAESEENKSNSDLAGLSDLLKGASTAAVQGKAGSGAYEACLNTALTTQAGFFATENLNSTVCEPAINQCKISCSDVREKLVSSREYILKNCENEAVSQYLELEGSFTDDAEKQRYIRNYHINVEPAIVEEYEGMVNKFETAENDCGVDAVSLQNKLKQTTNDFNNAAKQAQICRCQTGSTGEDCSAIKGPAECALNPNAAGCAMSTINCNNSDSLQCRCTRNPNLAECNPKNGGPSGFVNPGFKTTTTTPNGVSPKISSEDFDINFDEESNVAAVSGTSGLPTSPFGSAQAGGSGGGGGGAAGKAGEGDPVATAADEGGLKMLLDKAKGFVGNSFGKIFGTGTPSDKKFKTDAYGRKIDPNKWRPGMLRGVAGDGSEIGPKHRDIWKQMNSQYFLQEKTFIQEK